MPIPKLPPRWFKDVEKAVEYVSLIDAEDNLLYVNQLAASPETIAGQSVFDFVDHESHQSLRDSVDAARETGIPQHFNSYAVNTKGERSLYSNWVIVLQGESLENIIAFIATDVTELTRVEEELQISESTLRSLVENSPDTIFVVDRNRTLIFASKLEYGFDSSLVLGLSADLFVAEEDRPAAIEAFEHVLETGSVASYETTIVTPQGPRRFSARMAPINNHGGVDRVMLVATDITERHQAEVTQAYLQEQLQQAQKMEAIGQLTGGIAHDFNNIMLTISGNLELAQLNYDKPEQISSFIEDAHEGVRRARELTQRLLAFSRKQPLSPEAMEISALVNGMYTILCRTLGENTVVRMDTSSASGHASRADRVQLENAILNLALNARDAMPQGGELTVAAAWVPGQEAIGLDAPLGCIRLSVIDNGIGMDEETVAHAIDPFFTTKEVGEGTGLGLSMVYGFVQQSGGELRINSEPAVGTTVEIDLPCVDISLIRTRDFDDDGDVPHGGGELILLVEDDLQVRELTARVLKELGYNTLMAENGQSALEFLRVRDDIEMVITDVVMPGAVDGFELADRCRTLKPGLPIMLVSGHPLDKRVSGPRERWWDALLQKPYRTDELARFVARMLAKSV